MSDEVGKERSFERETDRVLLCEYLFETWCFHEHLAPREAAKREMRLWSPIGAPHRLMVQKDLL